MDCNVLLKELIVSAFKIELPKTSARALPTEKEQPLTLSLTKDKELYLQDTKIEFSDLIPKLKQNETNV